VIGDRVQVYSCGLGLQLLDHPDIIVSSPGSIMIAIARGSGDALRLQSTSSPLRTWTDARRSQPPPHHLESEVGRQISLVSRRRKSRADLVGRPDLARLLLLAGRAAPVGH
jgi:hypothetical protein